MIELANLQDSDVINRQILMADDDADDRFLVQAAFNDIKILNPIVFFEDGGQLVNYLSTGDFVTNPILIFLDLNMPKRDGREVLKLSETIQAGMQYPL